MLANAIKNSIVMFLIIGIAHLLLLNHVDGPAAKETMAEPSEASQKRDELLKFVMSDDDSFATPPFTTAGAGALARAGAGAGAGGAKPEPYAATHAFASCFSAAEF